MDDPGDIRDLILQVVELRKEVAEQRLALERLAALLDAGAALLTAPMEEEVRRSGFDPTSAQPPPQSPLLDRRRRPA